MLEILSTVGCCKVAGSFRKIKTNNIEGIMPEITQEKMEEQKKAQNGYIINDEAAQLLSRKQERASQQELGAGIAKGCRIA